MTRTLYLSGEGAQTTWTLAEGSQVARIKHYFLPQVTREPQIPDYSEYNYMYSIFCTVLCISVV